MLLILRNVLVALAPLEVLVVLLMLTVLVSPALIEVCRLGDTTDAMGTIGAVGTDDIVEAGMWGSSRWGCGRVA